MHPRLALHADILLFASGHIKSSNGNQLDVPRVRVFIEAVEELRKDGGDANDIFVMASNMSTKTTQEYTKLWANKDAQRTDLSIVYKERKGTRASSVVEAVHSWTINGRLAARQKPAQKERLHYKLTTTGADAIVMADPQPEDWAGLQVEQQDKIAILGPAALQSWERDVDPTSKVVLFSGEKDIKVWEEIFHHFGITSATVLSVGVAPIVQACMNRGIHTLALCKNAEHMKVVESKLVEYAIVQSESNEDFPYVISRKALIDKLGLQPDEPAHLQTPGRDPASETTGGAVDLNEP